MRARNDFIEEIVNNEKPLRKQNNFVVMIMP